MSVQEGHSAAGQALGYLHQVQWALVELARRAPKAPTTQLPEPGYVGDIEIIEGSQSVELTQVKHQVTPATDLTVNSTDLWRSLNVWMDVLTQMPTAEMPVLKLVTTASIPSGGALNFLRRDDQRNIEAALTQLEIAAREGRNQTSLLWREKFLGLTSADRMALLNLVSIEDGSPSARNVSDTLREALHFALPRGHEETFINYLLAWWYRLSVQLLDRTLEAISVADLETEISDLRDRFLPDNLPMAPDILVPFTEEDAVPYRSRQFVMQLMWIALDEPRLWRAIRDYHRAWAQRSEWLRLNLIGETELERYAFKLYDEWDYIFHERLAQLERESEPSGDLVGQQILERLGAESRARVRARFDEPWLNRGTLHALAEGWSGRTIGWHPEFATKLEQLLAGVAT